MCFWEIRFWPSTRRWFCILALIFTGFNFYSCVC
jgi:hypothetical protein